MTRLFAGVPVSDLDAARRREHGPIETYSNGVRHVNVPDRTRTRTRSPSRPTPPRRYGSSRSPLELLRSAPTSSVAGAIRLRTAREEPALTS
jgi:hypothetical protein